MSTPGEAKCCTENRRIHLTTRSCKWRTRGQLCRFEHRYADWLKYQKPLPHMVDYIEIFFWTAFGSLVFFDNTGVIIVAEAVSIFSRLYAALLSEERAEE